MQNAQPQSGCLYYYTPALNVKGTLEWKSKWKHYKSLIWQILASALFPRHNKTKAQMNSQKLQQDIQGLYEHVWQNHNMEEGKWGSDPTTSRRIPDIW